MTRSVSIAVVEDDEDLNDVFASWLRELNRNDMAVKVHQFATVGGAEEAFAKQRFDVISLDLMFNHDENAGVALWLEAFKRQQGLIIVVSGNPVEFDGAMRALDVFDCIPKLHNGRPLEKNKYLKPFFRALAKIQSEKSAALSINPSTLEILYDGKRVRLTASESKIASLLYEKKGSIVGVHDICQRVITGTNKDNIKKHVSNINQKFRDAKGEPDDWRQIIPSGQGYCWVEHG